LYSEEFVTGYIHVVPIAATNDLVGPSTLIARVADYGSIGCGSGLHLHMDVVRVTNTTWHRSAPFTLYWSQAENPNNSNAYFYRIEPFGWYPIQGFDPWGYKSVYPAGALSSYMWRRTLEPPSGAWAN